MSKKMLFVLIAVLLLLCLTAGYIYSHMQSFASYPRSANFDKAEKKFFNQEPQRPVKASFSTLWSFLFDSAKGHPPKPLPERKPDWAGLLERSERARFIWFGHSSLIARVAPITLLFDPVFDAYASPLPLIPRFQDAVAQLSDFPPIDFVLISHDHYDHLSETSVRALRETSTHFIVPLGIGYWLKAWDIEDSRIHELDWWESFEQSGIKITAVPARHSSGRGPLSINRSLWAGYVVETANERFYFTGDGSQTAHFQEIAKRFPGGFDIAFIENGQYNERWPDNHLFPEQSVDLAVLLKAKRFMPIHWAAYSLALHSWNAPVLESVPLARQKGIWPLTPLIGEGFDAQSESRDWFSEASLNGE